MNTKILRHLHRAQHLQRASFGDGLLPWIIDPTYRASENKMTMESIKALLHRIAHERPFHMLALAVAFWNESYKDSQDQWKLGVVSYVYQQVRLRGHACRGDLLQEIEKQILHEGWTLGLKCQGYTAFLEQPWHPTLSVGCNADEVQATLNHNGHVYDLAHFTKSLASIGTLWRDIPDFEKMVLEVFVEINNLLNMIPPRVILTLPQAAKTKVKVIGGMLLSNCATQRKDGPYILPLISTYLPASAVRPSELVQQGEDDNLDQEW